MNRLDPLDSAASLSPGAIAALRRLMASWSMLADFCFSDLILYVRGEPSQLLMVNHIRPTTAPTVYPVDLVGEQRTDEQRPLVAQAFFEGNVVSGSIESPWLGEKLRVTAIPIRYDGVIVAVLAREFATATRPRQGELEMAYEAVFDRFATMIFEGSFPFEEDPLHLTNVPRVGDGVIVIDADGLVSFSSPNATSALMRFGVRGRIQGRHICSEGFESRAIRATLADGTPHVEELDGLRDHSVSLRALPLLQAGAFTGAVILVRDITDVKRRDRMLLSKDATIREIHHRVKNNLQTISSLLRIQSRRLTEPSAKLALDESVRRIASIALVHETLSLAVGDDVPFAEVVRPLARMVQEGLVSRERPVRFVVEGDGGVVASPVATSLSLVITELLQNAVEHGTPLRSFGDTETAARVDIRLSHSAGQLTVCVADQGVGLPAGFDPLSHDSLGLTIVRTLVETELRGTIRFESPPAGGTTVVVEVPTEVGPAESPSVITRISPHDGG
jgi:two-component sensor histidine kinase